MALSPTSSHGSSGGVASVAATDASIVIGGTATAPTIATGTLDVIAAQHAPAASVAMNAKKITGLANGSAATDAAAYGQLAGVAITRGPYSFTYATAGLSAGVAIYTPTIGDILLDAWLELDTLFDGTTPRFDMSQYTGSDAPAGLWGDLYQPIPLAAGDADTINHGGGPLQGNTNVVALAVTPNGRMAPARFTTADPLLIVCSQDGMRNGTAIDSAQGAARVYLVTATPVAL